MIKGDYATLNEVAKTHLCPEHNLPVVVAWQAEEDSYVLRCGANHFPIEVSRQKSLTQMYQAGEELPEHIEDNIKKSIKRRSTMSEKQPTAMTFAGIPTVDLATGQLLEKGLVEDLITFAYKYSLDPYRGHVVIMYGKPYIGLDGYLYHAKQQKVAYSLQSRPMTTEELKDYKIGETDHGWLAWVRFPESGGEFNGIGIVTYEEMTARSSKEGYPLRSPVVAAHPWQLAQKRAEWQALRRAFPIGESEAPQ